MKPFDLQPTPNPNSLKFAARGATYMPAGMESFGSAREAESHPLGRALFSIDGVANVFMLPQFVTITKRPDADWDRMLADIERVLAAHLEGQGR
jgi:hypothetical protein